MVDELRDILLSICNAHYEEHGATSFSGMDLTDVEYDEDTEEVSYTSADRHQGFYLAAINFWKWEDGEEGKELHIFLKDNREIIFSMISYYEPLDKIEYV